MVINSLYCLRLLSGRLTSQVRESGVSEAQREWPMIRACRQSGTQLTGATIKAWLIH